MKFTTTIKITTEASDKNEAMEIAGEYLSGNPVSGVDMRLSTISASALKRRAGVVVLAILTLGAVTAHLASVTPSRSFITDLPGNSVIQPPLNTSMHDKKYADFKKEWQEKHTEEVLNSIK